METSAVQRVLIPSDVQLGNQRVDHSTQVSVMLLGHPTLPLIRRP
ncbi:hypothetical protein I552_7289 [Mycobacterium xenopi 3993]|nr:hypothetical protein I552_7289 [Mycobacterium xenopi 3993]